MALLAMAISNLGHEARSFTGSQAGIITTSTHGKARVIDVTPGRIQEALKEGAIAIVAGFQGVSQDTNDITTLGRGGICIWRSRLECNQSCLGQGVGSTFDCRSRGRPS